MVAFPDEDNKHFPVRSVPAHTNVCFLLSSPQGMYLSFDSVHLVAPPRSKVTVLPSNVILNFLCQDSLVTLTNDNKIAGWCYVLVFKKIDIFPHLTISLLIILK